MQQVPLYLRTYLASQGFNIQEKPPNPIVDELSSLALLPFDIFLSPIMNIVDCLTNTQMQRWTDVFSVVPAPGRGSTELYAAIRQCFLVSGYEQQKEDLQLHELQTLLFSHLQHWDAHIVINPGFDSRILVTESLYHNQDNAAVLGKYCNHNEGILPTFITPLS